MSDVGQSSRPLPLLRADAIPVPVLAAFRGIGQVFFQENALTGAFFALGIAINAPLMALAAIIGSALGMATAKVLKYDEAEIQGGIYGFNSALVGIATLFFFRFGVMSLVLMIVGCVLATLITRLMRRYLPIPTYTLPFILVTWALYLVGPKLGASGVTPGGPPAEVNVVQAVANGIGQVMFQANFWTGLLFLIGIGLSNWRHAAWVVLASALGVLAANYHVTPEQRGLDPEQLVRRFLTENIGLGLYSYNATLPAIALFLWRRSLIPPLLGIILSVPLTELVPKIGLPALTLPFVLATWIVLALGWFEAKLFSDKSSSPTP